MSSLAVNVPLLCIYFCQILCLFSTLNCITRVLSYSMLQFEIPVLLAHLLQEHTPNLVVYDILCGEIVLILCKFGFYFSFQEYMNHTNGNYIYLKL